MSKLFALIRQTLSGSSAASASVARDRLSVMLVHQRNSLLLSDVDMAALQKELAQVIQKYIKVTSDIPINYSLKQTGELEFLEIHFPLDGRRTALNSPQA